MTELFAEAFLESPQETERQEPEHRYDEDLSLCVLADGRVYVEHAAGDGTHTAVRGEADDWAATRRDTETITLVQSEGVDWSALPQLDTITHIRAEADDWSA